MKFDDVGVAPEEGESLFFDIDVFRLILLDYEPLGENFDRELLPVRDLLGFENLAFHLSTAFSQVSRFTEE